MSIHFDDPITGTQVGPEPITNRRLEVILVKILYTRSWREPCGTSIRSARKLPRMLRKRPHLVYPGNDGSMAESDAKTTPQSVAASARMPRADWADPIAPYCSSGGNWPTWQPRQLRRSAA